MPMPRTKKNRRKPLSRQRLGGVSISLQNFNRAPYVCRLIMRKDGKTVRQSYFQSKAEAEIVRDAWRAEAGNLGARAAATFTDSDKRNWLNWRDELGAFQKDIKDAVEFYLEHLRHTKQSKPVSEAIDALLDAKEKGKRRPRYVKDLRDRLNVFSQDFGKRMIGDISANEIERWLDSRGFADVTWNNYRRILQVLFSFADKKGWCETNVVAKTSNRSIDQKSPEILTIEQTRNLLDAAESEILPYYAIALFAGVRDEELSKLDWNSINLRTGYITIEASVSKVRQKRLIPITDNLRAWLTPLAKARGLVTPAKPRALKEKARRDAGITEWPHDATRHSYGTYLMAQTANIGRVSEFMGNSPVVVKKHYQKVIEHHLGDEFFSIVPGDDISKNVLPFAISA